MITIHEALNNSTGNTLQNSNDFSLEFHENRFEGSFEEYTTLLDELQKLGNFFEESDQKNGGLEPVEKIFKFKKDIMRPFSAIDDDELYANILQTSSKDENNMINEFIEDNVDQRQMKFVNMNDFLA